MENDWCVREERAVVSTDSLRMSRLFVWCNILFLCLAAIGNKVAACNVWTVNAAWNWTLTNTTRKPKVQTSSYWRILIDSYLKKLLNVSLYICRPNGKAWNKSSLLEMGLRTDGSCAHTVLVLSLHRPATCPCVCSIDRTQSCCDHPTQTEGSKDRNRFYKYVFL